MIQRKSPTAAFTLIELLVVITIIGILASIALPVYSQVQERGQQTKSLAYAKQIGLSCKLYATDNEGQFPSGNGDVTGANPNQGTASNSNAVFRNLFPTYCSAEKLFYTPKSAFCNKTAPDERYTTNELCLAAGENQYSYVTNLTDTSNAALPLLFDGVNSSKQYVADRNAQGGVWGGKKAIVIHVDDSGEIANVDQGTFMAPTHTSSGGAKESIFTNSATDGSWLSSSNVIKNPDPSTTNGTTGS